MDIMLATNSRFLNPLTCLQVLYPSSLVMGFANHLLPLMKVGDGWTPILSFRLPSGVYSRHGS